MRVFSVALAVLLSTSHAARTSSSKIADAIAEVVKDEQPPVSQGAAEYCSTSPDRDRAGWETESGRRHVIWYGGSFDPPTRAHLNNGRIALEEVGSPCVWFSPIYHPHYKPNKTLVKTRRTLLEKSFGEDKRMQLSNAYEESFNALKETGVIQPIQQMDFDAYRWLVDTYPNTDFDMIVGADNFLPGSPYTFEGWKEIMEMVDKHKRFIGVIPRGDDKTVAPNAIKYQETLKKAHGIGSDIFKNLDVDNSQFKHVSSSRIRQLLGSAKHGVIDEALEKELLDAGFSEALVAYMRTNTPLVLEYARFGRQAWKDYSKKGRRGSQLLNVARLAQAQQREQGLVAAAAAKSLNPAAISCARQKPAIRTYCCSQACGGDDPCKSACVAQPLDLY